MSTGTAIVVSLILLTANAFFVGAEFALIAARRSAIEPRAAGGGWAARTTLAAMENVSLMMAAAQLGITICSLGLGYLGEPAIAHLLEVPFEELGVPEAPLHPLAFAIALSIIGYLHVVLGEMVPKNLALAGPDRAALLLAPPLTFVVRLLRPVIAVLNWIANSTLRLVGSRSSGIANWSATCISKTSSSSRIVTATGRSRPHGSAIWHATRPGREAPSSASRPSTPRLTSPGCGSAPA